MLKACVLVGLREVHVRLNMKLMYLTVTTVKLLIQDINLKIRETLIRLSRNYGRIGYVYPNNPRRQCYKY